MKIQKLEPSAHKRGRWLVWLEDGALLRVGEGDVVSLSLYTGKELNEEEAAALTQVSGYHRLHERAVELLSARAMSRRELEDKLSTPPRPRKGARETPPLSGEERERQREELAQLARQVAGRMEELGLLDDGRYAQSVAEHYAAKGYGLRRVREELYRRGIPKQLWEEALAPLDTGEDTLDALVRRRLHGAPLTRENLKKTSDYLARRGYGWEEISAALRRYGAPDED